MGSSYINEPPTRGKVLLHTTIGDIEIELWSKECPKACRNFVLLCAKGYYDNTIFHRVQPGFVVQGGDPTGTGHGGESAFGEPFKDEFHSRIRFNRRGLVAMANEKRNSNGSQFFITLDKTPELQNKHTLFGKITGQTLFNVIRLADRAVDEQFRPLYPEKILRSEVIENPFDDITISKPEEEEEEEEKPEQKVKKSVDKKCLQLLSFGDEAEDEEEATNISNRGKSAHDILADEKLLSKTPSVPLEDLKRIRGDAEAELYVEDDEERKKRSSAMLSRLQSLKEAKRKKNVDPNEEEDLNTMLSEDEMKKKQARLDAVTSEYKALWKELRNAGKDGDDDSDKNKEPLKPSLAEYYAERERFVTKSTLGRGSTERERETLKILQNFKGKLKAANEIVIAKGEANPSTAAVRKTDDWMAHKFVAPQLEPEVKGTRPQDVNMFVVEDLKLSKGQSKEGSSG